MRVYSDEDENILYARSSIVDWAASDLITPQQKESLLTHTPIDIARINGFLRAVLFFFTCACYQSLTGFVYVLFSVGIGTSSAFIMGLLGIGAYVAAEKLAARRFYRHGIEEAFAVMAVGYTCTSYLFFTRSGSASSSVILLSIGAALSFGLYLRFGYLYGVFFSIVAIAFIPIVMKLALPTQRILLVGGYSCGLALVELFRKQTSNEYQKVELSAIRAMLVLLVYVCVNLLLTSDYAYALFESSRVYTNPSVKGVFYWMTFAGTWFIPIGTLWTALRQKDKPLIGVGIVIALLTLITNKPYLGLTRHTWDPMLLGAFLMGTALFIRRWLSQGPQGMRHGYTAERISAKDKALMGALGTVSGMLHGVPGSSHQGSTDPNLGGGRSGGGGAQSGF